MGSDSVWWFHHVTASATQMEWSSRPWNCPLAYQRLQFPTLSLSEIDGWFELFLSTNGASKKVEDTKILLRILFCILEYLKSPRSVRAWMNVFPEVHRCRRLLEIEPQIILKMLKTRKWHLNKQNYVHVNNKCFIDMVRFISYIILIYIICNIKYANVDVELWWHHHNDVTVVLYHIIF